MAGGGIEIILAMKSSRRNFLEASGAVLTSAVFSGKPFQPGATSQELPESYRLRQQDRRRELWGLLGDLPWTHRPAPAKLVSQEDHDSYTLERLVLDLNGIEPVPAILLIPKKREPRAPGLLYIHWHGGMYDLGKEQLLNGVQAQPAYASLCAEKGLVTLAIDSWCFGERKQEKDGSLGEQDTFKLMLWRGRVLYGMMMFDEYRAMDYLASRPEVDSSRLGAFGMSMGASKAWWLSALDPRVKVCLDVCCLTDYEELIHTHGLKEHGIYYYVPSLLKHFQTADINELIVPRPHLSVNGRKDPLTPPAGVEKIRERMMPLYRKYGKEQDCHIELFDCAHVELPEMRKLILQWMDQKLAKG
jgi:dienelactone hydrolase